MNLTTKHKVTYPIVFGAQAFDEVQISDLSANQKHSVVVVDGNVLDYHGEWLRSVFTRVFHRFDLIRIEPGEESKSTQQWLDLMDHILEIGIHRNTPLIAAGGGVTGDLSGFVAATVLRGIPLIQVPTTLLAMVDSAIGGKTGINHKTGKNLIGSFYQPRAVISDLRFLNTLPAEEWKCGWGEVLKYALLQGGALTDEVLKIKDVEELKKHPNLSWILEQCAAYKIKIVEKDEKESGVRMFLNLGHTFAHAIENILGYGRISHGEAVYWGLIGALYVSNKLGYAVDMDILKAFKSWYSGTILSLQDSVPKLISAMKRDKKSQGDASFRLVLLSEIGSPIVQSIKELDVIKEAWHHIFEEASAL